MLKQSTGWAVATLVAAFVAGGLVAWGLSARLGGGGYHRGWRGGPGGGGGGPGGPRGGGAHSYLARELDLSAAQQDSVRAIFERHRPEMQAMWRQMRARFDSLRAGVDSEIATQLTPSQRKKFAELSKRLNDRPRREPRPPPDDP